MKKALSLLIALSLALATLSAATIPSWGGKYTLSLPDYDATGVLYLIPAGEDATSFYLSLIWKDGTAIVYDTDNQPIPVEDGRISFNYPDEEIDYSIEVDLHPLDEAGHPVPGCVAVKEILRSEEPVYNIDLSPDGLWTRDPAVFPDEYGYLYRLDGKDGSCRLTRGGIYEGKVTLPASVIGRDGREIPVSGIDADAFMDSRLVKQVELSRPEEQLIYPGALSFTSVPYDWSQLKMPYFCYPSRDKMRYAVPMDASGTPPDDYRQWLVFKQNIAPCRLINDWHMDSELSCGRRDGNFDTTQGLYYTPLLSQAEIAKMFRGYESYEIEALVADQAFVAFHTFPSYSRWKFPEPEKPAPNAVVRKVCQLYGRQPLASHRAAWLRDGSGELDIVEFTHENGQATVCFVYQAKGEIYATTTLSTDIREGEEDFSVWNVDDDGTYGIPDVVSIAVDPEGYCNFFLAKNSPESITCFVLHQVEDKLVLQELDQWYRFLE